MGLTATALVVEEIVVQGCFYGVGPMPGSLTLKAARRQLKPAISGSLGIGIRYAKPTAVGIHSVISGSQGVIVLLAGIVPVSGDPGAIA